MTFVDTVHVIGATGRSGLALCKALFQEGVVVQPLVRNLSLWKKYNNLTPLSPYKIDLDNPKTETELTAGLKNATHVVSTAHARYIPHILKAGPKEATYIFLGSTRKYTHWPDEHGMGVLYGEKSFLNSGMKGVILHPTMIYGAEGENNVQRLAKLLKKLPIIPLPRKGKSLIQPIYQTDVTKAIVQSLYVKWSKAESLIIAGPSATTYADFIYAISTAAGIPPRPIVSIPLWVLTKAAFLSQALPFLPTVTPAEIQRLVEDKAFDIRPMQQKLGFTPISLKEGLEKLYA